MSRNEVRWERMFPDELEQAFAASPVVYFPYGLCEPHGPHCALGLDALKAHAIVCRAAQEHGGIVAPPDYWHIHEISGYATWSARNIGEVPRAWLTAIPPWQHFKNVCYHVRAADTLGFQAALFFTGHYGPNWQDLKLLLEILQPHVGARLYGLPDFEANETLWSEVVVPRLPEFRTMQYWEGGERPAAESRWHANWPVPDQKVDGSF